MSAADAQTDRELLLEIHHDVKELVKCTTDHEDRIRTMESRQLRWLGRDGAIVAGISGTIAAVGLALQYKGP